MHHRQTVHGRAFLLLAAILSSLVLVTGPLLAQGQGARIQFQAKGEDGKPIAGGVFDFVPEDEDGKSIEGSETDKKGKFTVINVHAGIYQIELKTAGYRVARVELSVRNPGNMSVGDFNEDVPEGVLPTPFQVHQGYRLKMNVVLAEYDAAARGPQSSLAVALDDSKVLSELNVLFQQAQMEQLAEKALEVVREHPDLGGAWYLLAVGQWQTGKNQEAVTSFRKAAELVPDQPGVKGALGSALLDLGDDLAGQGDEAGATAAFEEAAPLLAQQCAETPEDMTFLVNRVVVLERLGRSEELIPAVEALLAANPDELRAYLRLAELHAAAGDQEKAIEILDSIPNPDHTTVVAMYNIAVEMYNEEQYDGMFLVLGKALAIEPDSPDCHRLLGRGYLSKGDNEMAIAEMKKYLELIPEDDPAAEVERALLEALEKE
jgi:tetratricopeptide (TPR) repeat protein